MKHCVLRLICGVLACIVVVTGFSQPADACTVTVVGLRKEFRRAENVFEGEVVSVKGVRKGLLPPKLAENWDQLDEVTFRITRGWKGSGKGVVTVFSNVFCTCPMRELKFEPGRKFMIFADDGFADACSMRVLDIKDLPTSEYARRDIAKLDSFWFRTWATVYPF